MIRAADLGRHARLLDAAGVRVGQPRSPTRRRTSPFPGYLNINSTNDVSISLTKVAGRHTIKTGFYNTHSYKARAARAAEPFGTLNFAQDDGRTNPFDTSFGFANAAIGIFSSYTQASQVRRGQLRLQQHRGLRAGQLEGERQLTLDYGMRFVHQQPQYDELGQASNFLPDKWALAQAPVLYVAGCANDVARAPAPTARRMNPLTGQFLGPNTDARDRHARAEHRQPDERPVPVRQGHRRTRPTRGRRSASRRASAWPTT